MRIGIDGRALQVRQPAEPWGGVGQFTYHLLHAFFGLDRENEYHVFYNAHGELNVPNFSEYHNVQVHRTRWPNILLNLLYKAELCTMAQSSALEAPDLFFMPNLNFIAIHPQTKLIAVAHDLSFEHFPEHFPLKTRLWHRAVNPRALFHRADHVIAVSEHTKGDLMETYGVPQEKISVIYPGVNQSRASSVERLELESPSPYPLAPRRYILYFGALEPRKNIEGIIEAYELLYTGRPSLRSSGGSASEYRLIIAGLSTTYVKHLKTRIARSSLNSQITLIENPTEEQKHALYSDATLFVYPSFYEGFGFPPLEAMAAGVPVVASSASSVPEVCGDAALLVSPWNVSEIKEGMRIILEDEKVRAHYITAGRSRVRQYSWQRSAQHVLQMFKAVR